MRYSLNSSILLLLAFIACSGNSDKFPEISTSEYSIYRIAIDSLYHDFDSTGKIQDSLLVLLDSTVVRPLPLGFAAMTSFSVNPFIKFKEYDPEVDFETLKKSYIKANSVRWKLCTDSLYIQVKTYSYPDSLLRFDFGRSKDSRAWESFYERYPKSNGVIAFSRIGFDASVKAAIVFYSHAYGELGFQAGYLLFKLQNNKWVYSDHIVVALS